MPENSVLTDDFIEHLRVEVDDQISDSSENTVQNKIIKKYVDDCVAAVEEPISSDDGNKIERRADGLYSDAKGEKGDRGASAYEVAVERGFEGTEDEWLLSLQGADGKGGTYEEIVMGEPRSWAVSAEREGRGTWVSIGEDVGLYNDITEFDVVRFEIDPADVMSGIQTHDFDVADIVFNPSDTFETGGSRLEIIGNWVKDEDSVGSFGAYHTTLSGWFKDARTFYVDRIGTASTEEHEFRLCKITCEKRLSDKGFGVDLTVSDSSENAIANKAIKKYIDDQIAKMVPAFVPFVDIIETGGDYTVKESGTYKVTIVGGGGGGGGGGAIGTDKYLCAGGGGGGAGYVDEFFVSMKKGETASIMIGAGGTAGVGAKSSTSGSPDAGKYTAAGAGGATVFTYGSISRSANGGGAGGIGQYSGSTGGVPGGQNGVAPTSMSSPTHSVSSCVAGSGALGYRGKWGGGGGGGGGGSWSGGGKAHPGQRGSLNAAAGSFGSFGKTPPVAGGNGGNGGDGVCIIEFVSPAVGGV